MDWIYKAKNKIAGGSDWQQYVFVIRELTGREIKRKYARSYLGIFWSILNPLLTMIVMSLIFSFMFRRSIAYFPLYYLTGQIIWTLFSTSTNQAMTALLDNKQLLIKTQLPHQTFVLSRIYTAFVNFLYSLIPFVAIIAFFRIIPTWRVIFFIPDLILIMLFAIGIGYILSTMYMFFADIKHLYGVVLTIWMYMSAIFYPVNLLPGFVQTIIGMNPVFIAIYIARESVIYGHTPYFTAWLKLGLIAVLVYALGDYVFHKNRNAVMQKL